MLSGSSFRSYHEVMDIGKINKAEDAYIPEFPSLPILLIQFWVALSGFLSILIILVLYMLGNAMKTQMMLKDI